MSLGAALLVVANRDDRRVLFDCCDQLGFHPIYSARDFTQAQMFFEQDSSLALVVVEFGLKLSAARAFTERVGAHNAKQPVRVVGVLAASDANFEPFAQPGVHAWVRSPADMREIKHRMLEAIRSEPSAGAVQPLDFTMEQASEPCLLSAGGKVVKLTSSMAQLLGAHEAQLIGQDLSSILELDDQHSQVWLKSAVGPSLKMRSHVLKLADRTLWFFSEPEPATQALAWLESCRASFEVDTQTGSLDDWANRLAARHGFTLFAVVVERASGEHEPQLLAASERAHVPPGSDALWEQPIYREAINGERVLVLEQASKKRTDPYFRKLKLEWICAIPLKGELEKPVGMLLAGGQSKIDELATMELGLQILAGRFALEWSAHQHWLESRYQGLHDQLTRLPNRLLFNDRLAASINEAQRSGEQFAVLFVDLDRFKNINETLGHLVGDEVLLAVTKRLRATVRGSDTVARFAGDEFVLILRHMVQRDDVLRIADKIVRVLATPVMLSNGGEVQITSSLGVSFFPVDGTSGDELLKHADSAMHAAKNMGRNNVQTYVAVKEDSKQQRLALESKLRHAERNKELRAFYQPKLDTTTEDIIGMEALIRWEHAELGLISPGFFIPLAEDTGLIVPIGEWILHAACADCKRWNDKYGLQLKVSVNLSALQLKQSNLVDVARKALKDTQLPAHLLDLEVTESLNLREIPGLLDILTELRGLGCTISIDDFGTGQASLEYLKRFPCDAIKIDQTFVRNIGIDPDDEAIVRATIAMAHNMGLTVVAEGVETEDHFRFLRDHQCEHLQGFLFCRPLPALSFENLLAEREKMLKLA
jgi:diguanylate cyclase (GGDEF)-like protein